MTTLVWINTQFTGFHRWVKAPEQVAFLRDWHRHVFHVKLAVPVSHGDREVEFFTLKEQVNAYLKVVYEGKQFEYSCEHIAQALLDKFTAEWVEVSEDGENGATVVRDPGTGSGPVLQGEVAVQTNVAKANGALLPTARVRKKCFIGTEAEGPNRGKPMLFIPGSVSPEEVREVHGRIGVWGAYYGAGNDQSFRPDTFAMIRSLFSDDRITVETARATDAFEASVLRGSTAMTVSMFPGDGRLVDYVKAIAGNLIVWVGENKKLYMTALDDPLFEQDAEV